ncbi:mannitol dehydrogenase C-terminal domain protein [Mycobacterium xenopi 3993]|nr:mannitol dehydrogenase C-terminal domain protein [Mycobacterium xenopi 3993]
MLLVDDVSPYEAMKLRLLNAGHQCLCYFAWLCGYRFVHDAARDPLLADSSWPISIPKPLPRSNRCLASISASTSGR